MGKRTRIDRRLCRAAILAVVALALAIPGVSADDGLSTRLRSLDWATLVSDDGVPRWLFISDVDSANVAHSEGINASGVPWMRVTYTAPNGVAWSRTRFTNPAGGSRIVIVAEEPNGVRLTYTVAVREDGSQWVGSSFTTESGEQYTRRSPGVQLLGVEWT